MSTAGVGTDVSVVTTRPRAGAVACEIGSITGARPCNAEPGACHRVTTGNRVATGLTAAPGPVAKSDPEVGAVRSDNVGEGVDGGHGRVHHIRRRSDRGSATRPCPWKCRCARGVGQQSREGYGTEKGSEHEQHEGDGIQRPA